MNNKFNLERRHYPVLERYAYLDTSTTGAIPQYACNAICTYLQERTCLGMDIDYYHEQWEYADCVRQRRLMSSWSDILRRLRKMRLRRRGYPGFFTKWIWMRRTAPIC